MWTIIICWLSKTKGNTSSWKIGMKDNPLFSLVHLHFCSSTGDCYRRQFILFEYLFSQRCVLCGTYCMFTHQGWKVNFYLPTKVNKSMSFSPLLRKIFYVQMLIIHCLPENSQLKYNPNVKQNLPYKGKRWGTSLHRSDIKSCFQFVNQLRKLYIFGIMWYIEYIP